MNNPTPNLLPACGEGEEEGIFEVVKKISIILMQLQ
jgi:hypothetical protein